MELKGESGDQVRVCVRGKKPIVVLCFFLSCSVSHESTFFHSGFPDLQPERLGGLVRSKSLASCFSVWKSAFLNISPCLVKNVSFSSPYG